MRLHHLSNVEIIELLRADLNDLARKQVLEEGMRRNLISNDMKVDDSRPGFVHIAQVLRTLGFG